MTSGSLPASAIRSRNTTAPVTTQALPRWTIWPASGCDDITQNPGKLRIRPSGSAGGHNGLKSIIARLGGENFPRIRIGVGAKPRPDYDLADWVLGKFPPDDAKALADRCPDIAAAAKLIMDGKLGLAQSKYNG